MGRPRKPTALKLVTGTDRADRRNGGEPEPSLLNDLTPPSHLPERSQAVWRELAPRLREMQVLTVADVVQLEILCDSVANYRLARERMADEFTVSGPRGGEMLNQLMVVMSMCAKRAESIMSRFGMDPVSRSRVIIDPQADLFPASGPNGARSTSRFFPG